MLPQLRPRLCVMNFEKSKILTEATIVLVRQLEVSQGLMTWLCSGLTDHWERQTLIISL